MLLELLTILTGERPQFPTEPTAPSGDRRPQLPIEERLAPELRAALADAPQLIVALNDANWPQLPKWLFDALERTPTLLTAWRALPEADSVELGVLLPTECHALFLAHRKKKHAAATADDASKVCVALGNHPLAVELAANVLGAKRQTWSESDLFSALKRARLPVLSGGTSDPSRTIPVIAEALLATIPEAQRRDARLATVALRQLGDAPVPRSLLVRVLGGPAILGERADSAIEQLTDAGLLDPDGPPNAKRLRLHTLLWEWAKTLGEAPEQASYVSHVRGRLLDVLRQHDNQFTDALLAHLVQAQENAEKAERWQQVIEYARSLAEELHRLGHTATVQTLLTRTRRAAEKLGLRRDTAWALNALGIVAKSHGDYEAARTYYQESLAIRKDIGLRAGIASVLTNLGSVAWSQGDLGAARSYYQDSLAFYKELGDRDGIASTLLGLGIVAASQGEFGAARAYYQNSLALYKEQGVRSGMAASLNGLGNLAFWQEDYEAARKYYQDSLALHKEFDDQKGIAANLDNLGNMAALQGDYGAARSYYEKGLAINIELGDRDGIASTLMNLGNMTEVKCADNQDAAGHYFEQARQLAASLGASNQTLGKRCGVWVGWRPSGGRSPRHGSMWTRRSRSSSGWAIRRFRMRSSFATRSGVRPSRGRDGRPVTTCSPKAIWRFRSRSVCAGSVQTESFLDGNQSCPAAHGRTTSCPPGGARPHRRLRVAVSVQPVALHRERLILPCGLVGTFPALIPLRYDVAHERAARHSAFDWNLSVRVSETRGAAVVAHGGRQQSAGERIRPTRQAPCGAGLCSLLLQGRLAAERHSVCRRALRWVGVPRVSAPCPVSQRVQPPAR